MDRLIVHEVLTDKVLVSRESARLLEAPLRALIGTGVASTPSVAYVEITVDFAGVEGMAPSFLDELVTLFESLVSERGNGLGPRLHIANPPTRLSSKFEAVARGHALRIDALPNGAWLISSTE